MDDFSIPERIEPVAPTENTRRTRSSSYDQRPPRKQHPHPAKDQDDDDDSLGADDAHNIDELA